MHKSSLIIKSFLLFVLGFLSTFSIEPYKFYPAIICFSFSIFFILRLKNLSHIFILGCSFSFGWFLFGLYWIGNSFLVKSGIFIFLMPIAIIILPLFLSFFWGGVFLISRYFSNKFGEVHLNFVIFITIWEYIRGHFLNFPWLMPGDFFSSNNYSIQAFSYLGSFSMNLVLFLCLILPIIAFKYKKKALPLIIIFIIPISYLSTESYLRYKNKKIKLNESHKITLIQPNVKQELKWKNSMRQFHYNSLRELSNKKSDNNEKLKTKLFVWPETAFVGLFPRDKETLLQLSNSFLDKNKQQYLFTGLISKSKKSFFNSAVLINSRGEIQEKYDKNILVPFGEYLPLSHLIPKFRFLEGKIDFAKGKKNKPIFIDDNYEFLPLICYEIIFSNLIRKSINSRTSLLLNITNDAWFGNSIGPSQHFQFAKIRAVEFGIPVVRVANTGFSGFITPFGEVINKIELNKKGISTLNLINNLESTLFKKYGNKILILLIIILFTTNILFSYLINRKRHFL